MNAACRWVGVGLLASLSGLLGLGYAGCSGGGSSGGGGGGGNSSLAVTAVQPSSGMAGDAVTISGTGFDPAMAVTIKGSSGTIVQSNATSATVIVPPVAPGQVSVTVSLNGQTSNAVPFTVTPAQAAFPDECQDAQLLTQLPCVETVDASQATRGANDPLISCFTSPASARRGDASVWFTYTATATEDLVVDTHNSNYDTVLAVFTGGCGALTEIACNDNDGASAQSSLVFTGISGTTYWIEVVSWTNGNDDPAPGGNLVLTMDVAAAPPPPPPPTGNGDECSGPLAVGSLPFTTNVSTASMTRGTGDPIISCIGRTGDRSVWHIYTAPADETLIIDTIGSSYDTVLAVFDGGCGALNELSCNDDATGLQSSLTLNLSSGQMIFIEVTTFSQTGPSGTLVLNVAQGVPPGPTSGNLFSDLLIDGLDSPQVFGSGLNQTFALTSLIKNIGTAPAPGSVFGNALGTFKLRLPNQGAVLMQGDKGPIFLTNNGGCDQLIHDAWMAAGQPFIPGSTGAPTYTDPGCSDFYSQATNNSLTTPLVIGNPATVPDGNYEYELEFDLPQTYAFELVEARANNRGWVPIAIGTAGGGARTVTVTGPLQRSGTTTVTSTGTTSTLIGNGDALPGGGLPTTFSNTSSGIGQVWGVNFNSGGQMFFTLWNDGSFCRDNGNGTSTKMVTGMTQPMVFDFFANDDVVIADYGNDQLITATAASNYVAVNVLNIPGFTINDPTAVCVGPTGLLYVVNSGGHEIIEYDPVAMTATRVAGAGTQGFSGDGGPATAAELSYPLDVDVTASGLLIIADGHNNRIRAVNLNGSGTLTIVGIGVPAGQIVSLAGGGPTSTAATHFDNGTGGFAGDQRHGFAGIIDWPFSPRVLGNRIYFLDGDNHRVRVIDEFGYLHTLGGNVALPANNGFRSTAPTVGAAIGDGGAGAMADVNRPRDLRARPGTGASVDLFFTDTDHLRVRSITGVSFGP